MLKKNTRTMTDTASGGHTARRRAMSAMSAMKKADQVLSISVRLERLINSLPPGIVNNANSLKAELQQAISSIERAAFTKATGGEP